MIKNLALKHIQKMGQYLPPLDGRSKYDGVLLDFNERTTSSSLKVLSALEEALTAKDFKMYPEYFDLETRIADYVGVKASQVMITNGSDQGIDIIFRIFTAANDKVIIPTPSFAMFFQCANIVGNAVLSPLYGKVDLSFPADEVIAMIYEKVKLIVICNPNNPTGTLVSIEEIEKIAKIASGAIVLVDEAYYEFSKLSAVSLIKKYPNVVVTRTFSKAFGLAGLRLGYVIADELYVKEMLKVRGPYDVNSLAYYAASSALDDLADVRLYVEEVMFKAKPLVEEFFRKNGIRFYRSSANFILFKPDNPKLVERVLCENGFLVRPQNKENIEGTIRVSVGTFKQMFNFVEVYKQKILNFR